MMKTCHGNLSPKSPTLSLRDRDASFSSYLTVTPDLHNSINREPHDHSIGPALCAVLDDSFSSTSELSNFYANEVTNNNNSDIQKVTISSSNSRVAPLFFHMDRKTRRNPSASPSSVEGYGYNIINCRSRSISVHAGATPTVSSSGAISVSMRNLCHSSTHLGKKIRASLLKPIWLLRRKCACSGKKPVEVNEKTPPEPKTPMPPTPPQNHIARDSHSLDLKKQQINDTNPKKPIEKTHNKIPVTPHNRVEMEVEQSQRVQEPAVISEPQQVPIASSVTAIRSFSTDGFTFPVLNLNPQAAGSATEHIHKEPCSCSVLQSQQQPIDRVRERQNSPSTQSPPKTRIMEEDAASDASSDLFEIDTFSTLQATLGHHTR